MSPLLIAGTKLGSCLGIIGCKQIYRIRLDMKYVGVHVSTEGGVFNAPLRALELGAKAFAFFTKNQRRWFSEPYTEGGVAKFKENLKKSGVFVEHILAHAGYLINLGHPDVISRKRSLDSLIDEMGRCEQLGVEKLVFHPGSHLQQFSETECLDCIVASINAAIASTSKVILVIENMAGQGSNMGYKFEQLSYMLKRTENKSRVGVCIDTCHLFASGYDFSSKKGYAAVWNKFNETVGLDYLQGMHLNDSKCDLGSLKDRHDSLGRGKIGLKPFEFLMNDPRFDNLPLILETADPSIWAEEIKLLYDLTLNPDS